MISPTYRKRVKCELADRSRRLLVTKGTTIRSSSPGRDTNVYRIYRVENISIRCERDGYITISMAVPSRRTGTSRRRGPLRVISFAGKGYRFGRNQTNFELILEVLNTLRRDMVLDDLAYV